MITSSIFYDSSREMSLETPDSDDRGRDLGDVQVVGLARQDPEMSFSFSLSFSLFHQ